MANTTSPRLSRKKKHTRRRAVLGGLMLLLVVQGVVVNTILGSALWNQLRKRVLDVVSSSMSLNYTSVEEQHNRSSRFPSVQRRVQFYMSSWYAPPCPNDPDSVVQYQWKGNVTLIRELPAPEQGKQPRVMEVDHRLEPSDQIFLLDLRWEGRYQTHDRLTRDDVFLKHYAVDVVKNLFSATADASDGNNTFLLRYLDTDDVEYQPLFFQWGDSESSVIHPYNTTRFHYNPSVPHFKKTRAAFLTDQNESVETLLDRLTGADCYTGAQRPRLPQTYTGRATTGQVRLQPILWNLNAHRHFALVQKVAKTLEHNNQLAWSQKKNQAVFRGGLNGKLPPNERSQSFDEICSVLDRCHFVRNLYYRSSLIEARLTQLPGWTRQFHISDDFRQAYVAPKKLRITSLLQYKVIIILEGNDVASGLKWALMSNSVVLMPPPKASSWAMEELLQPWVHYVPLYSNLTNAEEQVQWVLDHEVEAQQISHRGTLWMKDLLFHPQATEDEAAIYQEMLKCYRVHFRLVDNLIQEA